MRFNIQKRHKKHCKSIILPVILILSAAGIFCLLKKLEPAFWSGVEGYAAYTAEKNINAAVFSVLSDSSEAYSALVDTEKSDSGEVSAVHVNTFKLNMLKARIADNITEKIYSKENTEISLKLGSIYKSPLFAGIGPNIKIKLYPTNQAVIQFKEAFSQSGINQVKHTIYLDITVNFTITSSVSKKSFQFKTQMPIADTIIVGTMPKYYGGTELSIAGE